MIMKTRLLTSLIFSSVVVENSLALSGSNDCSACKNVVDTFLRGMTQTKKAHFGGGNTAWEEERLGKYQNSEVRYHDVVDFVCKSYDSLKLEKDDERKCHDFMADHEEDLETWYFHKQNQVPDLKSWFCIEKTKTCCPVNHWGPECQPCPGLNVDRPCFGRGKCDGEGTRKGTGKCKCDKGYLGNLCRKCSNNYFASSQNETHITCDKCDKSCKGGCSGPESKNCLSDCKPGWKFVQNEGCVDVDECLENPCNKQHEICTNNVGSFVCGCQEGYKREKDVCVIDVTESDEDGDDDDDDKKDGDAKNDETEVVDKTKVQNSDQTTSENAELPKDEPKIEEESKIPILEEPKEEEPAKEDNQKIDTQKEKDTSPKDKKMDAEHRRKVREHLKQVMETIENLGKKDHGAAQARKNQFRYQDPKIQSIMDKMDEMKNDKKSNSFDSIRKIEL